MSLICQPTCHFVFSHKRNRKTLLFIWEIYFMFCASLQSIVEQMELNVMVFRVAWTSSTDQLSDVAGDLVGVRMTNHTKCGCQCVTKPTDCDNKTQHYSRENCRCECKPQQVRCPFNHRWDPIKCECRCNPSSKAICGKRREFDDNRCACVCSSKSCRHNKVRDLTDCRCKCLHRKCSPGMIYDRRTCTCKGNIP